MVHLKSCVVGLSLLLGLHAAAAQDFAVGDILIDHPWAAAGPPVVTIGAGYMSLGNIGSTPDKLLSASSAIASEVELHMSKMEGDMMVMRKMEALELPAGGVAEFKPGGMHMMFIGLKEPFEEGKRFPVTLIFEKAGEITVEFVVEGRSEIVEEAEHNHTQ